MKFIAILFVFLTACGSSVTKNNSEVVENSNENMEQIGDIPFMVLYNDSNSSFESPGQQVFTDSKDLENALSMVNRTRQPGLVAPEIDFTRFNVALLHMGGQNTGGFAVNVERVERTEDNIIVYYKNTYPQPGEMVTMALTSPWTMVRFENKDLPVVFAPINY